MKRDGVFKKNGWWWIDYVDADGQRHREKAAPSYDVAVLVYRDRVNAIVRGTITGHRDEAITVATFVDTVWWPRTQPRLNPDWATRVRYTLDAIVLPTFGGTKLVALNKNAVDRWISQRAAQVSASTLNKECWVVKNIARRAVAWGYLRIDPTAAVSRAREAPGRVRFLSDEERRLLLDGADVTLTARDGRTWTTRQQANPTLRLYVLFALNTGCRRAEAIRVTWADVDLARRRLTFRNTKNGDHRTVPLTDTVHAALAALPGPHTGRVLPPITPAVLTRSFQRLTQRLGIKGLTYHDLRHDVASTMAQAGIPMRAIAEVLGHRDGRMTYRYAHLTPDHLRDAMATLERP